VQLKSNFLEFYTSLVFKINIYDIGSIIKYIVARLTLVAMWQTIDLIP